MTTTSHTVPIAQVRQLLLGARHRGLDIGALLARSDIAPALLEAAQARVSQLQYVRLMRVLRRSTRDEFWGLCDTRLPLGTFAQCCRGLIHAPTLQAAMRDGFRFFHGVLGDFVPRLRVEDGVAKVWVTGQADSPRLQYAARVFVFFTLGLASWLVARRIPLSEVSYVDPQPGIEAEVYAIFDAPIRYAQPHFGFAFDARWLTLPVVQDAQSLKDFLRRAPAGLVVRYRDQTSVTERIRRLLRHNLKGETPSMNAIAKSMAMSPQTLRRRLADEGQRYQVLIDDLRRDAAIELLARPDLSLLEVAEQVGFSEASTFHRAFKKWTGVTPGEYKRQEHS